MRVKTEQRYVDNRASRPQPARFRAATSEGGATLAGMSFLVPDTGEMYSVADRISAHAAGTRQRAAELAAALGATDWHGLAADTFDAAASGLLASMRTAADRLDDAAAALRQHAANVNTVVRDAEHLVADGAALGSDLLDGAADSLTAPQHLPGDALSIAGDVGSVAGDVGGALGDLIGL